MDYELVWTELASSDIEAIVRYIARRNPEVAGRIGFGIFDRAQELLENPELGSVEASLPERSWRKLIFRRWKILYSIDLDRIIVGRVWPCAMDEINFDTPLDDY